MKVIGALGISLVLIVLSYVGSRVIYTLIGGEGNRLERLGRLNVWFLSNSIVTPLFLFYIWNRLESFLALSLVLVFWLTERVIYWNKRYPTTHNNPPYRSGGREDIDWKNQKKWVVALGHFYQPFLIAVFLLYKWIVIFWF